MTELQRLYQLHFFRNNYKISTNAINLKKLYSEDFIYLQFTWKSKYSLFPLLFCEFIYNRLRILIVEKIIKVSAANNHHIYHVNAPVQGMQVLGTIRN